MPAYHVLNRAALSFAAVLCLSIQASAYANFIGHDGNTEEYQDLYEKINARFKNKCPKQINVVIGTTPGVSQFNTKTSEVLINSRPETRKAIIAHESIHLCMNAFSRGASNTPHYRFIDEGYAEHYSQAMMGREAAYKQRALDKTQGFLEKGWVNFGQAVDWPAYFGQKGKGGRLGFEAYLVGSTFYYYVKDTYGEDAFFKLVEEIGTNFTFNRALKATFEKNEEEIEGEWLAYIRSSAQ